MLRAGALLYLVAGLLRVWTWARPHTRAAMQPQQIEVGQLVQTQSGKHGPVVKKQGGRVRLKDEGSRQGGRSRAGGERHHDIQLPRCRLRRSVRADG